MSSGRVERFLRSTGFRLAAWYMLVFALSLASVAAVADHFEFKEVIKVEIAMDHATNLVILHDPGHSLDERILREQFGA